MVHMPIINIKKQTQHGESSSVNITEGDTIKERHATSQSSDSITIHDDSETTTNSPTKSGTLIELDDTSTV